MYTRLDAKTGQTDIKYITDVFHSGFLEDIGQRGSQFKSKPI